MAHTETDIKDSSAGFSVGRIFRDYVVIIVLIVITALFAILQPSFLTWTNLGNILWQNSYMVVASLGMGILMISGGVDLSAGFGISFSMSVTAAAMVWWNLPIPLAIAMGIATNIILSMIIGILAVKLRIHQMMVSLGTMSAYMGVAYIFTKSRAIYGVPAAFKFIGQGTVFNAIPVAAVIMIVVIAVIAFMLRKTYFGRYLYAVGGNPEAARLAGIKVDKIRILASSVTGALFGVSSVLLVSRVGSASASIATDVMFSTITACLLGGVTLQGGEGKVWGIVVGAFILGILSNGMQLVGLGTYPQHIAKGVILIAAMGFNEYQKIARNKIKKDE